MGFGFLVSSTAHMFRSLFPILAVEYGGLTAAETGMLYLVATVVTLMAGPMFGWLADNVSLKLVLMTRSVADVVASVIYWSAPSLPGFVVGKAVDEAGKAAFHPAWGSLMAEISGHARSSRPDHGPVRRRGGCRLGRRTDHRRPRLDRLGRGALMAARIGLAIVAEVYAVALLHRARRRCRRDG